MKDSNTSHLSIKGEREMSGIIRVAREREELDMR
jgi:hypothetical protein